MVIPSTNRIKRTLSCTYTKITQNTHKENKNPVPGLNKVQQATLQQNFSEPLTALGILQGLEFEDHALGITQWCCCHFGVMGG